MWGILVGLALSLSLALPAPARAIELPLPLVTGPQDASQIRSTLNTLINQINQVLVPTLVSSADSLNRVSLTGGLAGAPAIIGLTLTSEDDASIGLTSNGNGDIILFAGNTLSAGLLQFANAASFIPAMGLGVCPGVDPERPPFGVADQITGYVAFRDWLGVTRALPAC